MKAADATTPLRGVLCQMRKATDTAVAVGTFTLMENEANLKLLMCPGGGAGSGITHSNNGDKAMAEFYWMAPADMGAVKVM